MVQTARNHHFVPQCYLTGFTDTGTKAGRLCAFDFVAVRFFRQKPKNVAFEVDFNRVDLEGQTPDALEKAFGEFEGKLASVIRTICQKGELPHDEDFSYVLNLIALLATHNPRLRRSMTLARQQLERTIGSVVVADQRTYEHHAAAARKAGFISGADIPYARMKEFIERGAYSIEISTDEHLQTELRVFDRLLPSLGSRYWSLLVAASGGPDFITCDHPANLVPRQIVFPLNVRNAVVGVVENPLPRRVEVSAQGVAEINSRIVNQADRQIYSRSPEIFVFYDDEIVPLRF